MENGLGLYRKSCIIILGAILALILFDQSRVFATDFGEVSVKVELITSGSTGAGYEEYRVVIVNRSPSRAHQITLIAPESKFRNFGPAIVELKRSVEVAPSATAKISVFLPPLRLDGSNFYVVIDGKRQEDSVPAESGRTGAWTRRVANKQYLLVSQGVGKSGLLNEPGVEEGFKYPVGNDVAYLTHELPLNEWSTNWLGYSRFDCVALTADELRTMPEDVRTALWRYLECGGSLLVHGSWEAPEQWRERGESIEALKLPPAVEMKLGSKSGSSWGRIRTVELKDDPRTSIPKHDLKAYHIGFGALIVTGEMGQEVMSAGQWRAIKMIWDSPRVGRTYHSGYSYYPSLAEINRKFPVIDRIGVPVRGLFVMMILFVVVIGPVNMFWLARRKRKIWLLWTVPAISLLTSLAISAFAIFGEGLGATLRTEAMTILDETSHRATTIGWTAFYSPITPGDGLHFSYETELSLQWSVNQQFGAVDLSLDWTNDQHLTAGWISARVPVYFKFRKSETRRERLSARPGENGSIDIVNGLGAEIRQLWWVDQASKIYTARKIPAGARANLTPTQRLASGSRNQLRAIYQGDDWLSEFNPAEVDPARFLMPNCYLAVLDSAPFVEQGLGNVKVKKVKTLVYGIQPSDRTGREE